MGEFGSKHSKSRPTKDSGHDTATRKKFNRQKENSDIVNNALDEILLQENNKVSNEYEAHKNIESDIYENDLYHIENRSLDNKR